MVGRSLVYNPDCYGAILAYGLDLPRFTSTIIYTSLEHDMVPMAKYVQVNRSQSCPAFTLGLLFGGLRNSRKVFHSHLNVAYNHTQEMTFLRAKKVVVPKQSLSHLKSIL